MKTLLVLGLGIILSSQCFAMSEEDAEKCGEDANFIQRIEATRTKIESLKSSLQPMALSKLDRKFNSIIKNGTTCEEIVGEIEKNIDQLSVAVTEINKLLEIK